MIDLYKKLQPTTAYCPKCQFGKIEIKGFGKHLFMKCLNCGATFNPDERVIMKLQNYPNGLKGGKLRKYGDEISKKVALHYSTTTDTITQTAKKFGISHATVGRMVKAQNESSKIFK